MATIAHAACNPLVTARSTSRLAIPACNVDECWADGCADDFIDGIDAIACITQGAGSKSCALWDNGGAVYNVLAYGADNTGATDAAAAINTAISTASVSTPAGGSVYLPPGTYKLDKAIVIKDNIELYGAGDATVLKRSATTNTEIISTSGCVSSGSIANARIAIINSLYDCGNTGIKIHDFKIDGSLITTMPCTSCAGGPTNPSVTIALSAITDSNIYNLHLVTVPQDGVFVKNAGIRTFVHHNIVDGFCMLWGNGGGINVEMHTGDGSTGVPANNPGIMGVTDNYIIARGPDFCDLDLHQACDEDADCSSGVCGIGAGASVAAGVLAQWTNDSASTIPIKAIIARNRFELTDNHIGINSLGMQGGEITENRMSPYSSGTLMSGVYAGINLVGTPSIGGGTFPIRALKNVLVANNVILGNASATNDRRAIQFGESPTTSSASSGLKIVNNTVVDRVMRSTLPGAIEISSITDSEISGNTVRNITSASGIVVGAVSFPVTDIRIVDNTIADINTANKECIAVKNATRTSIIGNTFRNCTDAIELQTATISGTQIGPNFGYNSVTNKLVQTVTDATLVQNDPNIRIDYANAPSTAPNRVGGCASKPLTCTIGDSYTCNDGAVSQKLYACIAGNNWELQGTTGSAVAVASHAITAPDMFINPPVNNAATTAVTGNLNKPHCVPYVPAIGVTNAGKIEFQLRAGSSGNCAICIYTFDGLSLIRGTGIQNCTNAATTPIPVTGLAAFSLTAGQLYRYCYVADNASVSLQASSNAGALQSMWNNYRGSTINDRAGIGANTNGGDCPATTGALTSAAIIPPYTIISSE